MSLTPAGIADIAADVRSGRRGAQAVLEACLERVDALNPEINAVVSLRADEARRDARRLDARIRSGEPVGALAGVPFTVKDVIATDDLPTTCGSVVMKDHRPSADAAVVSLLRSAGAILVGKTNTPEFAFGVDTFNDLFGRTNNPLGPWTPGGSSGGEAAAVAAGMSVFGVGTDFGGSIRWPAQCTGLVGLRPTVGLVPTTGVLPASCNDGLASPAVRTLQGRLQVVGPLARTVSDLEAVLRVVATDGQAASVHDRVPMSRVVIRWGTTVSGHAVDPDVAAAVESAVESLDRAGASAFHGLPTSLDEAARLYSELRAIDPLAEIKDAAAGREDELGALPRSLLLDAAERTPSADVVRSLWAAREDLCTALAHWLHGDRLLALPVATTAPFDPAEPDAGGFDLVTPSRAVALFGLPAISVPCGRTAGGARLSVQLVAPAFREDLLLSAARVIEQAGVRS